ncbi:fumarate hydratase, partial [Rhodospirillales bacterium]|nr:fumarate hydratase [Rhodospirillales bacterium]
MSDNSFHPLIPNFDDTTEYRLITDDFVETVLTGDREVLKIDPEGIAQLTAEGFSDTSHLLRTSHLQQLSNILDDPEASENDRFVALDLLKNANISAGRILPMCQDTGTAIVMGKKGENVWVEGDDEAAITDGIKRTYETDNLRYSQLAPIDMYTEKNTGNNLPAQIDIYSEKGNSYKFMFIAKGGGSANKTFLYQK